MSHEDGDRAGVPARVSSGVISQGERRKRRERG